MDSFLQRFAGSVTGCLSGFDRVLFRGTVRLPAYAGGLSRFLSASRVVLKDLGPFSGRLTAEVRAASEGVMRGAGRPAVCLADPGESKEDRARSIAARDGVTRGPVCLLRAVEPCRSYEVRRDRAQKKLVLEPRFRKCLTWASSTRLRSPKSVESHPYHYWVDEEVGFMHTRLQTWLPLGVRVCVNGREWLCRQLDRAGVGYVRRDNRLTAVSDVGRAQAPLDAQLRTGWAGLPDRVADRVHPGRAACLRVGG